MRILILTQYFDPEPFFKGLPFAKELVEMGHEVEVLTGFPNYPSGKLYTGYHIRGVMKHKIDKVSIIRVPLFPYHGKSAVKRILNYCSFAMFAAVLGPFLVKKPHVVYVYHPPPTVGFPAIILKLLHGVPFVYDIQDLWPQSLSATGMIDNKQILWLIGIWCKVVYRFADELVVLSPGFKSQLIQSGITGDKISVIYNWTGEEGLLNPVLPPEARGSGSFKILFAGNMGPAQALEPILHAAIRLAKLVPHVRLLFLGSGIALQGLKDFATKHEINNVEFIPRVSPNEASLIAQSVDALLVHLKDDPLFKITIPSKTQTYLAAGKPILIGIGGDATDLVERAGAGLAFKPECPDSFIDAVTKLVSLSTEERAQMGQNGKRFYHRHLSRNIAVKSFDKIFQKVSDRYSRDS